MRVVCTSQNYHHLSIMRPEARGGQSPTTLPLFIARRPYDNGMPNAVAGNLRGVSVAPLGR